MSFYYNSEKYQKSWRPVSIADANRHSVPWSRRIQAEDMLLDEIYNHQLRAAACALSRKVKDSECKTRPQKAPLYTRYPDYPAARACVGLSAIAEFNAHFPMGNRILALLGTVPEHFKQKLESQALSKTASYVAEAVSNRVCLDHLVHFEEITVVEAYRLFNVAMLDFRFDRLRDVIFAACILGDLVYALICREEIRERIHPLTHKILTSLAPACRKYEKNLVDSTAAELLNHSDTLARELMEALLDFLPEVQRKQPTIPQDRSPIKIQHLKRKLLDSRRVPITKRKPISQADKSMPLKGLDEVFPPSIDDEERLIRTVPQNNKDDKVSNPKAVPRPVPEVQQLLAVTNETLKKVAGQGHWGDPRVDEISNEIRRLLFKPGVVEQDIDKTRRKTWLFGCEREGYIHEKILPRSKNSQAVEKIINSSAIIEKQLRRFRWFGQRKQKAMERYQNRGNLDPSRLYKLGTSQLINRRWNEKDVNDYHGRPLVVLTKDGSSSNTVETTFAGQILTAAFLRTRHIAQIDIIAADYSSDRSGPLVQWLYHPGKIRYAGPYDAAALVASLAPKGQGGNNDVLSISYILQESLDVRKREQFIHVINVTDGKFNSPVSEVKSMVKKLREDYDLTYSFIVLGGFKVDVPQADYTISIPATELAKPVSIAERIAQHVNQLVCNKRAKRRFFYGQT